MRHTTGMSNMGYLVPRLLEETIGARLNVIAGYKGGNEIDLAVERGRDPVPFAQFRSVLFARTVSHLAQERLFPRAGSRGENPR